MPNWCANSIEIKFNPSQRQHIEEMSNKAKKKELLNFLVPIPEELLSDSYNWCIDNWGTKWDIEYMASAIYDSTLTIYFDTAWSPPVEAIKRSLKDYEYRLYYFESGVGYMGFLKKFNEFNADVFMSISFDKKVDFNSEDSIRDGFKRMSEKYGMSENDLNALYHHFDLVQSYYQKEEE